MIGSNKSGEVLNPTLVIGVLLIATNLRAPFTGLPPILEQVQMALDLSTMLLGALTALPLFVFAVLSPFSAFFASRYGLERVLFPALLLIALGILTRSSGSISGLYIGTTLLGVGIALGNVLLPSLIKRDFSQSITTVTGAYVLAMGVAAALASAVVAPLTHMWGWRLALLSLMVLPVMALVVWRKQVQVQPHLGVSKSYLAPKTGVWNRGLAWQVTLYLGLNSTIYYIVISWLPTLLMEAGLSQSKAGAMHGILQLATALPGLVLGVILHRMKEQGLAAMTVCLFSACALLGFWLMPQWALVWSLLFGLGTGSGIILGLAFIGLRTSSVQQAVALSGMAQCIGYLLASLGPTAMGGLYELSGGWAWPLGLTAVLALIGASMGVLAGRNVFLA